MSTQESLAAQSISSWRTNAGYWDATISKTGNKYWRRLQEPSLARLLSAHLSKPGCRALDLATGNGLCARWMLQKGATHVLATDGCEEMVQIARGYAQADGMLEENGASVTFRVVDVTSERDLQGLLAGDKEERFDVVLMNMAIMDVATLEPLAKALPGLLAKDGV